MSNPYADDRPAPAGATSASETPGWATPEAGQPDSGPPAGYDQGQYGQPGYDQGEYGQPGYDQGQYGQPGYGADPYAQAPQGAGPYGQFSYPPADQNPYAYAGGQQLLAPRSDYARWGQRVAAYLLDGIPSIVGMIIFYVGYGMMFLEMTRSGGVFDSTGVVPMIIGLVIMLGGTVWNIFNRWLTGGRTGQSWGKRVVNIKLISESTGAPIGPLNAFLRDLVHTIDSFAYVGYLWPLWDEKRQTFSDKIMTSIVVDAPAPGAAGAPH